MNAKLNESALAHIGHRIYGLNAQLKALEKHSDVPVSLRGILTAVAAKQSAITDLMAELIHSLQEEVQPLLDTWLLNLGAVVGERVNFTVGKRYSCMAMSTAELAKWTAGRLPRPSGQDVDEVQVIGTIAGLRMDQGKNAVSIVLDESEVHHRVGTGLIIQDMSGFSGYDYRKQNAWDGSSRVRSSGQQLVLGLPVRTAKIDDLVISKF